MLESLAVNVVVLLLLALLPRREAVRPEAGRRAARAFLNRTQVGRETLGEVVARGACGLGRAIGGAFDPVATGNREGWKLALAGGGMAGLGLLVGATWAGQPSPSAGSAALACGQGSAGAVGTVAYSAPDLRAPAVPTHRLPDIHVRIPASPSPEPAVAHPPVTHPTVRAAMLDGETLTARIEQALAHARIRSERTDELEAELEAAVEALTAEPAVAAEIGSAGGGSAGRALATKLRLISL